MEIHHYEKSDGCLIPLPAFAQLVKEKVQDMVPTAELHIQSRAVAALQLGAEAFLVGLLCTVLVPVIVLCILICTCTQV